MLKKALRLRKNFQFRYIYKHGKIIKTPPINLVFVKSKYGGIKIGISVNNKVGKAVKRNLLKRRIRAAVKEHIDKMTKGYNYIFVANSKFDFSTSDYSMISNCIGELLVRFDAMKNGQRA